MTTPLCMIDGCEKLVKARGWCVTHYGRWRRHSDPLDGGTFDGEPLAFYLANVDTDTTDCILWKYGTVHGGYGQLRIDGEKRLVHLLVCERHHGPRPEGGEVRRVDCAVGPACFNHRHLRWATAGTVFDVALSDGEIAAIRADPRLWRLIADDYGIERSDVERIKRA